MPVTVPYLLSRKAPGWAHTFRPLENRNFLQPFLSLTDDHVQLRPFTLDMAPKRGTNWANIQLKNLHTDLKTLQTSLANSSSSGAEKGGCEKKGKSVPEALDLVRKSMKEVAEHPYNQVVSSVNPGDKCLAPEARGPARRLHKVLKKFLESPESSDPEVFEKDVRNHLESLVSVLDPTHPMLRTTKAGKIMFPQSPSTHNYGCDI